jgi:chorismate mutase
MPDAQVEQAGGGTLRTTADLDDDGPYQVWCQLFEPGDVTQGGDGTDDGGGEQNEHAAHWNEEALREDIGRFAPDDRIRRHFIDGHPENPSVHDILGEALEATYDDNLGAVLKGEVDDRKTAELIDRGRVSVSPYIYRELGGYNEAKDARDVDEILGVRDYGIVRNGENESANINLGEPPTGDAPTAEALAATFDAPDGDVDGEDTTRAPADGDTNPDGEESGTETMADDDNPEDSDEATVEDLREENEQLRAELTELREADAEELEAENENLRDQLEELDAELEDLREQMEPVESQAVEAMSQRTDLPEDVVRAKFDTGEMVETLTEGEESPDSVAEALSLTPDPQSGDPDPTSEKGGSIGDLSSDDEAEIESLAERAETFDGVDDEYAETLRSEAADIAGVDDFEDLTAEVV